MKALQGLQERRAARLGKLATVAKQVARHKDIDLDALDRDLIDANVSTELFKEAVLREADVARLEQDDLAKGDAEARVAELEAERMKLATERGTMLAKYRQEHGHDPKLWAVGRTAKNPAGVPTPAGKPFIELDGRISRVESEKWRVERHIQALEKARAASAQALRFGR